MAQEKMTERTFAGVWLMTCLTVIAVVYLLMDGCVRSDTFHNTKQFQRLQREKMDAAVDAATGGRGE